MQGSDLSIRLRMLLNVSIRQVLQHGLRQEKRLMPGTASLRQGAVRWQRPSLGRLQLPQLRPLERGDCCAA